MMKQIAQERACQNGKTGLPQHRIWGVALAFVVVVVDQLSKWGAVTYLLSAGNRLSLTPFLDFTLAFNKGVSFSFLSSSHGWFPQTWMPWLLVVLSLALIGVVATWLWQSTSCWLGVAFGLVLGGAIGNLIDRLRLGAVIDFIDFHLGLGGKVYHFAIFNGADTAISCGVTLILWDYLWHHAPSVAAKPPNEILDNKSSER